jgi:hypothetical protein
VLELVMIEGCVFLWHWSCISGIWKDMMTRHIQSHFKLLVRCLEFGHRFLDCYPFSLWMWRCKMDWAVTSYCEGFCVHHDESFLLPNKEFLDSVMRWRSCTIVSECGSFVIEFSVEEPILKFVSCNLASYSGHYFF